MRGRVEPGGLEARVGDPALVGHDQHLDPTVLRRRSALDQAELLEPIDDAGEVRGVAADDRRELAHRARRVRVEVDRARSRGPGSAPRPRRRPSRAHAARGPSPRAAPRPPRLGRIHSRLNTVTSRTYGVPVHLDSRWIVHQVQMYTMLNYVYSTSDFGNHMAPGRLCRGGAGASKAIRRRARPRRRGHRRPGRHGAGPAGPERGGEDHGRPHPLDRH